MTEPEKKSDQLAPEAFAFRLVESLESLSKAELDALYAEGAEGVDAFDGLSAVVSKVDEEHRTRQEPLPAHLQEVVAWIDRKQSTEPPRLGSCQT